ncbi:MAG: hypothetical protein K9M45_14085 [Kiritimatiellales bacterium]|nr:hypothetical protein [Kiritimatiellales bacterium]
MSTTGKLAIAVVHYHLRPGGVTRVIERAVKALGDSVELVIIPGESARPNAPLVAFSEPFQALKYSNRKFPDIGKLTDELRFTARCLLGRDPDIWHIHNHSLGKNSAVPQIVWQLANEGCRLLLQPHDFAEDGRPENYRLLRRNIGADKLNATLYPVADHVYYAPINSRDKTFLLNAGITNVHSLPNAAPPFPKSSAQPPPDHRVFVYPARAIRRKNIGEFLLWSLLADEGDRFVSTLAPKNPHVRPLYDEWVRFAAELNLPVEFDAGNRVPFEELVHGSTALISTSIAEGFGLAFLEPWMAEKMLWGRNIPEITSDFAAEGLELSALYDRLPMPIDWVGEEDFFQALETAMQTSYAAYSKPWNPDYFEQAKAALVVDGKVDFGILSEPLQRRVIRHIAENPADRNEVRSFSFDATDEDLIGDNRHIVEERYGLHAYGERLAGIYQQLANTAPGQVASVPSTEILDQFLKPERFNLLRT